MSGNKLAILDELKRRQAKADKPAFDFMEHCFTAQSNFFRAEGPRFRTAVCSRRAGKTHGISADMLYTCENEKNVKVLYITLSKTNARSIIWSDLLQIVEEYELDFKIDNTRLTLEHRETKSMIYIEGAKDASEIEK